MNGWCSWYMLLDIPYMDGMGIGSLFSPQLPICFRPLIGVPLSPPSIYNDRWRGPNLVGRHPQFTKKYQANILISPGWAIEGGPWVITAINGRKWMGFPGGEKTLFIGIIYNIYNDLLGGPPRRTCIFFGCDDGSAGQMGLFLNKTPTRKNGMTCSVYLHVWLMFMGSM